ncbi:HAMP domain-containing histidine kinase [Sediminibacterium roseum]|uniref:histidine kinase n=1 Tax=Sediminibacterium roseum TaxID=1978412 RepID=A0ABX0A3J8_9BACT|nr:HAMP domain-containing sensor histidine kinase [Sediminibacterium roseum]NCI51998.1 HAMP domain-containing histidine kinase [Sediminibacterium roseum]
MKLFTKYNRVNITATILTFVVGSVAFYFVLDYVLTRQLDRGLRVEQQEVIDFVKEHNQLPELLASRHQWIEAVPTNRPIENPKPHTSKAYNKLEDEKEPIRQLSFTVNAGGKLYMVSVNQSKTETEDLLQLIILVTVCMIAFILLSNYLINRKLITRLWKPFYTTIDTIKDYQLAVKTPLQLSKQDIDELDLLNDSLNKMTTRIYQDYVALKTFTENASHEMQTPLAVIRSKVESMLQLAEGKELFIQQLLTIEDATLKLSKLHQSLLLLTKLGNRQFELSENINLTQILQAKLAEREELIEAQELTVAVTADEVCLSFHKHLAEIMINNLLNNVIRYTPMHGTVAISLNDYSLSIKNYAADGPLNKEKIFQRFYKEEQLAESTGLGLAIVKEICTLAGFTIAYNYAFHEHEFIIYFKQGYE